MTEYYIVRIPPDMPCEIRGELNAWYIESEPIVWCRDCMYYGLNQCDHEFSGEWWCSWWHTDLVKPDTFCAWGERKVNQ